MQSTNDPVQHGSAPERRQIAVLMCDVVDSTRISERIDPVYKELTKGKAAPHGGVAYLSLEDSDVSPPSSSYLCRLVC